MANPKDSLLPILGTLYPYRRFILRITLAAFVISVAGSLLLHNYYQGKTIFYAASQDLFKPEKVFGGGQTEMYYYGSGEDIDRILTVGNSHEVVDYLIDSFDLWKDYKIKAGTPKARYKMRNAFRENYNILLTKQDALELTVEDKDPERAAALANAAREKINFLVRSIIRNSQIGIVNSFQNSVHSKEKIMQGTLDTLIYYRAKSGIYDPSAQIELLATRVTEVTNDVERDKATLSSLQSEHLTGKLADTIKVIKARIVGAERELSILNSSDPTSNYSLKNFNASIGKVQLLENRYARSYDQITYDLEKLKLYNSAIDINIPALHLIEPAEVPLFKSKPKRSIIVLACTMAAFLFSLAAALVMESYKQTDWKGVFKG
jgi:tyrosine-protein kinase Etk/Wzc